MSKGKILEFPVKKKEETAEKKENRPDGVGLKFHLTAFFFGTMTITAMYWILKGLSAVPGSFWDGLGKTIRYTIFTFFCLLAVYLIGRLGYRIYLQIREDLKRRLDMR